MFIRASVIAFLLIVPARAQDMPLSQILIPGEGWRKVEGEFKPISGLICFGKSVWVFDLKDKRQSLLDGEGKTSKSDDRRITQNPHKINPGNGLAYIVNDDRRSLRIVKHPDESVKIVDVPLSMKQASAIAVTSDRGTLLIGDGAGKHIWAFRIGNDGLLSGGEKYMTLRVLPYTPKTLNEKPKEEPRSDVSAICLDTDGRIYAATRIGVQVFDPTGRLCGVLSNPSREPAAAMTFGGTNGDHLFVACGEEIYHRKLNAKLALLHQAKK